MKLPNVQLSPFSRYFIPLRSPQQPDGSNNFTQMLRFIKNITQNTVLHRQSDA
jgi:hypothetical protein